MIALLLIALLVQGFTTNDAYAYDGAKRPPNVGAGTAQAWARTIANGHAKKHLTEPGANRTTVGEFPQLIQNTLTAPDDALYLRPAGDANSVGASVWYVRELRNRAGNQIRLLVIIPVDEAGRILVLPNQSTAYFLTGTLEQRVRSTLRRDYLRHELLPPNGPSNRAINRYEEIVRVCGAVQGGASAVQRRSADPDCSTAELNQTEVDRNNTLRPFSGSGAADGAQSRPAMWSPLTL